MIILDTNIVSEPMRLHPEPRVLEWLDCQDRDQVRITAMTAAELRAGVALLPEDRRRDELGMRVEELLTGQFARRIVQFGAEATVHYAAIVAGRTSIGRPISVQDALIAATARAQHAMVATRNVSDFEGCGIDLVNPWEAGPTASGR